MGGRGSGGSRNGGGGKIEHLSETAPYATDRNRTDIEAKLSQNIENAKRQGYKEIPREYYVRGSSGRRYPESEINIEIPAKPSNAGEPLKLNGNSKLAVHYQEVSTQYNDVIVLPSKPILPSLTKGRGGWKTTYKASYTVLAKGRKE